MRILHFCLQNNDSADVTSKYLSALLSLMAHEAEVRLITNGNNYQKQAEEFKPDLVHIHDCWNRTSALMAKWAHGQNIPVVVSPHGKMDPWCVDHNYLNEKLPKLLLFQHEMICNADAIIVEGEIEQRSMQELSWNNKVQARHPWNKRIELIRNSIVSNEITNEEMVSQTLRLYRKVIDSNAWMLMTKDTREAEDILLMVGVAHHENDIHLDERQHSLVEALTNEEWRRLLIHADEENVLNLVEKAISRLHLNAPDINIATISRFAPRLPKARQPLEREKLLDSTLTTKFKHLRHDYGNCPELTICRMIANTAYEMQKATLSRKHLTEIYELFRYEEFDEDKLARMLKDAGLYDYTLTLQQTLASMLMLTEGFMPLLSTK